MLPHCKHLSIIIAVLYLALISVAALCMSSHEIQHSPIHHHSPHSKNTATHSPLCSWACQVSSKANAADTTHTLFLTLPLLVTGSVFLFLIIPIQATRQLLSARGPPIPVFS
jgi:hypothetical protein